MLSQQLQGHLQKQTRVDNGNYFRDMKKTDKTHKTGPENRAVEKIIFLLLQNKEEHKRRIRTRTIPLKISWF